MEYSIWERERERERDAREIPVKKLQLFEFLRDTWRENVHVRDNVVSKNSSVSQWQ